MPLWLYVHHPMHVLRKLVHVRPFCHSCPVIIIARKRFTTSPAARRPLGSVTQHASIRARTSGVAAWIWASGCSPLVTLRGTPPAAHTPFHGLCSGRHVVSTEKNRVWGGAE
jgi:hypothetical protein